MEVVVTRAVKPNLQLPVGSIYAQSWPIPKHDPIATHNAFSSGRSLNDDWVRSQRKQHANLIRTNSSTKESRARSAPIRRCTTATTSSRSFFDSDDEINDTVEEFKLTLQLFKRLTRQVREVNDYMSKHRTYNFKHYLNNEGIASPALRRSQLAAALSRREIPATQAPYEPITDLGPPMVTSRPAFRQEREVQSAPPRPSSVTSSRPGSSTSQVYTRQPSAKSTLRTATLEKKREKELQEADELAKEKWIKNDPDFDKLFVPEEIEPEDLDFRFHDPYPRNWVDETVEDVYFRGSKKVDPFMHRLEELEHLQEETVLWEQIREEKVKQATTSSRNKQSYSRYGMNKNTKVGSSRGSSAKFSSWRASPATSLQRAKSSTNRLKRISSNGRSSTTSNPVSGSEESDIMTFRNSGYTLGVSFVLGSMYPETIKKHKEKVVDGNRAEKYASNESVSSLTQNGSMQEIQQQQQQQQQQTPKIPHCEACHLRKSASIRKHHCKNNVPTLQAMRAQYALKAAECYDIVDMAETFDPPCKDTINNTPAENTPAEKAAKKGLVPGKSLHSQRRISLTSEGMAVRGINPALKLPRPVTGKRVKSSKGSRCKKNS